MIGAQAPVDEGGTVGIAGRGRRVSDRGGKVVEADRCAGMSPPEGGELERCYSGKTHRFGANIQACSQPTWVTAPRAESSIVVALVRQPSRKKAGSLSTTLES